MTFPNPNSRTDSLNGYSIATAITSKSHWFIGIEPGYAFSEKLLGYMKLSYHEMRANVKPTTSVTRSNINADMVVSDPETTTTFRGIGVGFGTTYKITSAFFVKAEAEWIQYQSKDIAGSSVRSAGDEITLTQTQNVRPSSYTLGVKLGYRF